MLRVTKKFISKASSVAQTARSAVSQAAGLRGPADWAVGDTADKAVCATNRTF